MFDIRDIVREARKVVSSHAGTIPGEYHRILKLGREKNIRTGVTAYGCADAACILYTLDELPPGTADREAWIHRAPLEFSQQQNREGSN